MRWYQCVAYFFGGAFLANTLPRLGNGSWGTPFRVRFASAPWEGFGGRDEGAVPRQSGQLFS
jgi:hypothetical protein